MAGDSPQEFIATVNSWVAQTKERELAVFRKSTERVVSKMQGRIPRDTGFARASIRASLESMPMIDPASHGDRHKSYAYDPGMVTLVIASATLEDTIYIGWTANYVTYLEYGHSSQAPTGFVGISAEEWPQIVEQTSADLMTSTQGAMG
jgi:hypothetical protein